MSEEIRPEEVEVTMIEETEDVKKDLSAADYGVIGGIMLGGILVFEGGKWVWKKTEAPRKKVGNWVKGIFTKNDKSEDAKESSEHEGSSENVAKAADEKKSENRKGNSKK